MWLVIYIRTHTFQEINPRLPLCQCSGTKMATVASYGEQSSRGNNLAWRGMAIHDTGWGDFYCHHGCQTHPFPDPILSLTYPILSLFAPMDGERALPSCQYYCPDCQNIFYYVVSCFIVEEAWQWWSVSIGLGKGMPLAISKVFIYKYLINYRQEKNVINYCWHCT